MPNNVVKVVSGLGAASVIAVSGAAIASSQTTSTSSPAAASSASTGHGHHMRGMHHGKPVTGATLAKVDAAIKAKDSSVTVKRVFEGPKGAFHAMGVKDGKRVRIEVSKDFKTVTEKPAGQHGRHGHQHGKPVTGAELAKVDAAIKAKDSSVTVKRVFEGPKGAFHAMGVKDGKPVRIEVSKDLKSVTINAGHAGQHGPAGQPAMGAPAAA